MSLDSVPKDMRGLRACKMCSLVKSMDQFLHQGCDNCERFLQMKNNREAVQDCTSQNFDGLVAVMSTDDSWVARWQRVDKFVKGCYAVSVTGDLPQDIADSLQDRGISYVSRNTANR